MQTGRINRKRPGLAPLVCGLGLMLAVSCAYVPDRPLDAGLAVPDRFAGRTNAAPVPEEAWWLKFGDTNLNALIDQALRHNQDLQAAVARVDAAAAQARIAGADRYPRLGAGFDASRSQRNFIGFPFGNPDMGDGGGDVPDVLSTRTTTFGLNLNVSWELDLWGRLHSGRRAAVAEVLASESDWNGVRQSLAGQTAKAWLAVVEARRQVELAESTVQTYATTAAEVRNRYERGIRPPLDLRLALANLAGAEALLQSRRTSETQAVHQLEILLGRYPAGRTEIASDFPDILESVPAGLPADLLARRPDLAAARQALIASDWRVAQSKAALLPRLSLTASGGTSTEELSDLLDPDFKVWNLAANLAQPIFQGGRLRAGVDLSKAQTRQALARYQSAVLRAFAEVESVLAAEKNLGRREERLREAAEQSSAALQLAQDRYQAGLDSFITVLEAQRRSLEADTQLVTVRRVRLENRVDLHLALGGGFSGEDSRATPHASNVAAKNNSP